MHFFRHEIVCSNNKINTPIFLEFSRWLDLLKINFEISRLVIYCLLRICLRFLNLINEPVYYQTILLCLSPIVCTLQNVSLSRSFIRKWNRNWVANSLPIEKFKFNQLCFSDKTIKVFFQLPSRLTLDLTSIVWLVSIFFINILIFIKDMVWLDEKTNKKIFYNITLIVSVQLHFLILIIQW